MKIKSEFDQGWDCWFAGHSDCPYEKNTVEFNEWQKGWDAAFTAEEEVRLGEIEELKNEGKL